MHLKTLPNKLYALTIAMATAITPLVAKSENTAANNEAGASRVSDQQDTAGSSAQTENTGSGGGSAGSSGSSGNSSKAGKEGSDGLPPGHPTVTYMIVPIKSQAEEAWMKKGCWAKFYDNENFSGDMLTLVGPADMPDMRGPFGIDWKGKITSVQTGPAARVLVYDNENYKDLVATFKPGQKAPNVNKRMGFFDEFSSMRIACDNL